jgi:hypothetical protein
MAYESDPAGLGVGKRYGPLHTGGMQGGKKGYGSDNEAVFEITFDELDASGAQVIKVPPYSRVTRVAVEVSEVFGTGDVLDITMAGEVITEAPVSVAALGILEPALQSTDVTHLVNNTTSAVDLTLDVSAIDAGTPETGKAKVVVTYEKL